MSRHAYRIGKTGMASKASTSATASNRALRPRTKRKYEAEEKLLDAGAVPEQKVRKRTKLGKLAGIMSMPMDVLFEVSRYNFLPDLSLIHMTTDFWSFAAT
jgi:hypothetical protein